MKTINVNGKEEKVVRGTSSLNTMEMHNFMEAVKVDAAGELGLILPLPEDDYYQDFINEYQNKY